MKVNIISSIRREGMSEYGDKVICVFGDACFVVVSPFPDVEEDFDADGDFICRALFQLLAAYQLPLVACAAIVVRHGEELFVSVLCQYVSALTLRH